MRGTGRLWNQAIDSSRGSVASTIYEFYGARPGTAESRRNAAARHCPFVDGPCKKKDIGACSLKMANAEPVVICPNRLYGDGFKVIADVSGKALGGRTDIVGAEQFKHLRDAGQWDGSKAVAFGQGYDGELSVTGPSDEDGKRSRFKIDFIVCAINAELELEEFAAIEVQTIDISNSYRPAAEYYHSLSGNAEIDPARETAKAGLNWENVNKRILPQIIYKGHALRREDKAQEGLFFVLPHQVYKRILTRVGGTLQSYPRGPGTVTFETYDLGDPLADGTCPLVHVETFTTTVDQIAYAFVSPHNLPELGSYDAAIMRKLSSKRR